jgi:hypothetical protein
LSVAERLAGAGDLHGDGFVGAPEQFHNSLPRRQDRVRSGPSGRGGLAAIPGSPARRPSWRQVGTDAETVG